MFQITRRAAFAAPLLVTCASLSLAGCASSASTSEPAAPAAMDEVTIHAGDTVNLTVWGMSCPKCVTNVDQLLRDVPGVESTSTDMANGIVTVRTGTPAPQPAALRAAVEAAGFTLMGVQSGGDQK